jgi:hypothetical protein
MAVAIIEAPPSQRHTLEPARPPVSLLFYCPNMRGHAGALVTPDPDGKFPEVLNPTYLRGAEGEPDRVIPASCSKPFHCPQWETRDSVALIQERRPSCTGRLLVTIGDGTPPTKAELYARQEMFWQKFDRRIPGTPRVSNRWRTESAPPIGRGGSID